MRSTKPIRRVPWRPHPNVSRRARLIAKHGKPTLEQQQAAMKPFEPAPPHPGIKPNGIADRALKMLANRGADELLIAAREVTIFHNIGHIAEHSSARTRRGMRDIVQ